MKIKILEGHMLITKKTRSVITATSLLSLALLGGVAGPANAATAPDSQAQNQTSSASSMDPQKGYEITPKNSDTPGEFHFDYKLGSDVSISDENGSVYLVSGDQKEELPTSVTSSDGQDLQGNWTHEGNELIFHQSDKNQSSSSPQVNTYLTDEQVKCIQRATATGAIAGAFTGPQGAAVGGLGSFVGSSIACNI
jgi:hypothetical protein